MSDQTDKGNAVNSAKHEALNRIALSLLTARCLMMVSSCVFFGPPLLLGLVLYSQTAHHTPDAGWGLMGLLALWPVALLLEILSFGGFVLAAAWASTLKRRRKALLAQD